MNIEELGVLDKKTGKVVGSAFSKIRSAIELAKIRAARKAKYLRLIRRLDRLEKRLGLPPL